MEILREDPRRVNIAWPLVRVVPCCQKFHCEGGHQPDSQNGIGQPSLGGSARAIHRLAGLACLPPLRRKCCDPLFAFRR